MAPARKIKSFALNTVEVAPIEFELGDETFSAYGDVPGAVLLDFVAKSGGETSADTATAILGYLKASMDEENWARFDKLIHDPKANVSATILSEIVGHLIEERGSRPTEAS
jgi:hypothetical protein